MKLFSRASPSSSSPHRTQGQGFASSPLLSSPPPPARSSPRSPSSGHGGSSSASHSPSVLRSPPLFAGVASGAARDELLALARQSRHLERRLQAQLDAQSAGLLAGLGLADDTSSQGSRPGSRVGHGASPSPARRPPPPRLGADDEDKPPPLPTTRRAIHSTLRELAELKSHEAATLAETLAPLNTFLANAQALETKKQGLEAAIAKQDSQDARDALQALGDEAESLQKDIAELEDSLATKRARLRHVQAKREHDASTLDARLSSWRAAAADVDTRIRTEVLAGRGLPSRSTNSERGRTDAVNEDVWALPASRRTVDLVREAVTKDRTAVEKQRVAASREAAAATAGADVWQSAIGAVRGVERVLRREMRRLTSNPPAAGSPTRSSSKTEAHHHPLAASPRRSSPTSPTQPAIPLEPLRAASPVAEPDSGTASFSTARTHAGSSGSASTILPTTAQPAQIHFAGPVTTYDATTVAPRTNVAVAGDISESNSPMRTVLAHMDAAIAALAKDVALAADRGWNVLVVAIGAELAALREGRGVLTGAMGVNEDEDQGIELADLQTENPRVRTSVIDRERGRDEMERRRSSRSARSDAETETTPTPVQRAFHTPYRDEEDEDTAEDTDVDANTGTTGKPLISLERGDTEDDAPSLDLLVEAAGEV